MRVLSLSTIYPNELSDSEGRSVAKLDDALAALGVCGSTLVLRPWLPAPLALRFRRWRHLAVKDKRVERPGVTVLFGHYRHVPLGWLRDVSARQMASRAEELIARHAIEFDLIHGQSIYPAALAAQLLSRRFGKPFIATLRDDMEDLDAMLRLGNPRLRRQFEEMFASVRTILVHGPALLRDVPRFLPPGSSTPVVMAPNGADTEGIDSILASLPPPEPRPPGLIVSVSRLLRWKGVHENLRALQLLRRRGVRRWRYTVVGDGPLRRELEAMAGSLGLREQVRFEGYASHREAIGHIRDCDVFSLPSWGEPFGNVYAEAAVCGKPVIACRGYGAELTVRDGETGILVPGRDAPALASAIGLLLERPETGVAMGARGREHIRGFTWEKTATLYKQVLDAAAAG